MSRDDFYKVTDYDYYNDYHNFILKNIRRRIRNKELSLRFLAPIGKTSQKAFLYYYYGIATYNDEWFREDYKKIENGLIKYFNKYIFELVEEIENE